MGIEKINGNSFVDDRGTLRFVNDFDFSRFYVMFCVNTCQFALIRLMILFLEEFPDFL